MNFNNDCNNKLYFHIFNDDVQFLLTKLLPILDHTALKSYSIIGLIRFSRQPMISKIQKYFKVK